MRRLRPAALSVLAALAALLLFPLGSSGRTSAANTWAGTWNSDFGMMTLTAGGSGHYEGFTPGDVKGTIKGNVLKGTWTQPGDPPKKGTFEFTMSGDGRSFSGDWAYANGSCGTACGWNGVCVAGPCTKNGTEKAAATPAKKKKPRTGCAAVRRTNGVGSRAVDCLVLSYEMPARYGEKVGGGYVVRSELDEDAKLHEVDPATWRVEVTVKACPKAARYAWKVDGRAASVDRTSACTFLLEFDNEGTYKVAVAAKLLDGSGDEREGSLQVRVQDWLIVGMGDSLASGEGAPVGPPGARGKFLSDQCDRSSNSWQSKVALEVEHGVPRAEETSVTFVHLACSGASILNGLRGRYAGVRPTGRDLAPQLERFRRLVGNREVDAVLLSVGVNEFRFGDVAEFCAKVELCMDVTFDDGLTLRDFISKTLFTRVVAGDPDHRPLSDRYRYVRDGLPFGTDPTRVYITEYPDFLDGGKCRALRDAAPVPVVGFQAAESEFLVDHLLVPLNRVVREVSRELGGWNVVPVQSAFTAHGYCATDDRWIVTLPESKAMQGNTFGALHPNETGHAVIAKRALGIVRRDLYPGGTARPPG